MKIIHLKGFTKEERLSYRDIIHSNVIMAMRAIVSAADKLGVNNILAENKVRPMLLCSFFGKERAASALQGGSFELSKREEVEPKEET